MLTPQWTGGFPLATTYSVRVNAMPKGKETIRRKCEICGRSFVRIGRHTRLIHDMSAREYSLKFIPENGNGKCVVCGKDAGFLSINQGFTQTCSDECYSKVLSKKQIELNSDLEYRKYRTRGFRAWGKSDANKERLEKLKETPEYRKKLSVATKKSHQDPELHEKMIVNLGCFQTDPKFACRRSEVARERWRNPEYRKKTLNGHGTKSWFDSEKCNARYHARSSWEKRAYEILEADDNVVFFEPEPFAIPYVGPDGKLHDYYPDILVKMKSGRLLLIEVKPSDKMDDDWVQAKIVGGAFFCQDNVFSFEIWNECKLWRMVS